MYYALVALEIVLAIVMICLVLLQPHEGEGMGAVFGGSSGVDTFLGTKTISVLWKTTAWLGGAFIVIAIVLNLVEPPSTSSSVEKGLQNQQKQQAPAEQKEPSQPSGAETPSEQSGGGAGPESDTGDQ